MKFFLACLIFAQPISAWADTNAEAEFNSARKKSQAAQLEKRALAAAVRAGMNPGDFTLSFTGQETYITSDAVVCRLLEGRKIVLSLKYGSGIGEVSDPSRDSLECYDK